MRDILIILGSFIVGLVLALTGVIPADLDISTISNLRNFPWLLNPVWLLLVVTLAFNFLGDALRDFFDPYHFVFSAKRRKSGTGRLGKVNQEAENG